MRLLSLLLITVLTLQEVYSQRRRPKLAGLCHKASMKYGKGYNPHPSDCSQYIECFYYGRGRPAEPVYRDCKVFGQFWDQSELRCRPARKVNCEFDKCKIPGTKFYKHSDLNKCNAYWNCVNGKAFGQCCPEGQGFHKVQGCIPMPSCKDMCPLQDRVPGCNRRPVSGAPIRFEQYTDNGVWEKEKCPRGSVYIPAECDCSEPDIMVPGRRCQPDVKLTFDRGQIKDISGNRNRVTAQGVTVHRGAAYFRGNSRLVIDPLKPSKNDEGVLIIKLRFKERKSRALGLQGLVTNGHCGMEPSVVIAKLPQAILLGAEANMSRSFPLPIVNKPWKEVIYIKDDYKLTGRVCGAAFKDWCLGKVKETNCGFQIGAAPGLAGYIGLIDDISIYRCKPLDAVVNISY